MKFKVDTQLITIVDPGLILLVNGTGNYYEAEFEFSPEWEGFTKTAVFRTLSGTLAPVLLTEDKCGIPNGVVVDEGYFVVGVYGVNSETSVHYPTIWSHTIQVEEGCSEALDTITAQAGIYEQLLAATNAAQLAAESAANSASAAEATAESVEQRADSGEFSSTITVGATTTGAAGTQALVFNSGTEKDAVLEFTIPQGAQGPRGYQGPTGTSAYQYAQSAGYTGTEAEFAVSMAAAASSAPLTDAEIQQIWEEN